MGTFYGTNGISSHAGMNGASSGVRAEHCSFSIPYYSHTIEEGARVQESGTYLIFCRVDTLCFENRLTARLAIHETKRIIGTCLIRSKTRLSHKVALFFAERRHKRW